MLLACQGESVTPEAIAPTPSPTFTQTVTPTFPVAPTATPAALAAAISEIATEAPTEVPVTQIPAPVYVPNEWTGVKVAFFQGFREAGGVYDEAHINRVIQCESLWNPLATGGHLGLAQFAAGTWATISADTGLTDWTDPYSQGFNMAAWAMRFANPGATQWPYCWNNN